MDLRDQNFGIEIEFTGITRKMAARVVAKYFDTSPRHIGGTYDAYTIKDECGRIWKIVSDASLTAEMKSGYPRTRRAATQDYKVEFVSPICQYEDIPKVQQIVRNFRGVGAFVNDKCGIHVHVDASNHDTRSLRNIVNIMASKEDLFYKALDIKYDRQHYCKKADKRFLEKINRMKPQTREQLSYLWYGDHRYHSHYDSTRYHALNLHSVFTKGTVEFRMFNSTMHAGKIKTYIQFCLAISAQAINQKKASTVKTRTTNDKYTFRTWLLRLGMKGKEFETARKFLLENLEGCIAWKDPAQAEAQKERLRAIRESQSCETVDSEIEQCEENTQEIQAEEPLLHL